MAKGVYRGRISDDLKSISLLRQLFPIKDSTVEDMDLILEMAVYKLTAEDVIDRFESAEFARTLGVHSTELYKAFTDFLADFADQPESLDNTIKEYCQHTGISYDTVVDALNQWLTPQLKSELIELF